MLGIVMSVISVLMGSERSSVYIVISVVMLICGVLEMVLGIRGRRSNYVFAMINGLATAYIAWSDQFYGMMVINCFYVVISIVGFYSWGKYRDKKKDVIARKLSAMQVVIAGLVLIGLSTSLSVVLWKFGGRAVVVDSISTILITYASALGVLRYREQWLLWGIVDVLAFIMWIETGNLAAVALRALYVVGSIYGYYNWRKFIRKKRIDYIGKI